MLDRLFGESAARILLFIHAYDDGYASEIAANFGISLSAIQKQLRQLEEAGVLSSRLRGRLRLYQFNPRYPFLPELRRLFERAMEYMPAADRTKYYERRTRPRRAGKPL
jgi:DNA-binding transcriptional ArsR family regulator